MKKKIVFIGHEASRTGAPIFLLHLLRWMQEHADSTCELVLLTGGELEEEYRLLLPCTVLRPKRSSPVPLVSLVSLLHACRRAILILCDRLRARFLCKALRRRWKRDGVDLFSLNSIVSGNAHRLIAELPAPLLLHVHELSLGIECGIRPSGLIEIRQRSTTVIAASRAVKRVLVHTYGFADPSVRVIYEAIAPDVRNVPSEQTCGVRNALGIGLSDIVVGMCGTLDWRKGVDLFLQLARTLHVTSAGQSIHFLWIGGGDEEKEFRRSIAEQYRFSAPEMQRIHFIGPSNAVGGYLAAMDLFALTSREDPFPLAHLEAASSGLPIVCFQGAGGAEEWVGDGAGFVVPFGDIPAMAAKVQLLADDPHLRESMGEYGKRTVAERFTIERIGPQMLAVIKRTMGGQEGPRQS